MSKIALEGNASGTGTFTIASPNSNNNRTLTLPDNTGTIALTSDVSSFPAGTAMLFVQTAAPTGWTKSTTHNDKALRIVSGSASSGGSVAFTTAFASQAVSGTVGNTTLTTTQIPSHTHSLPYVGGGSLSYTLAFSCANAGLNGSIPTGATGGGGSHNHSFSGTAINLAVQYVDVIIATKD